MFMRGLNLAGRKKEPVLKKSHNVRNNSSTAGEFRRREAKKTARVQEGGRNLPRGGRLERRITVFLEPSRSVAHSSFWPTPGSRSDKLKKKEKRSCL